MSDRHIVSADSPPPEQAALLITISAATVTIKLTHYPP